jgi:hypothetical protein
MQNRPGAVGPPHYRALLDDLPVAGASIAVFDRHGHQSTIWASDTVAATLEQLQFDLGQGPHWRALATGEPVLIPNLSADSDTAWPLFGAAAATLPVGAMFAFPLTLGAVSVGVLDLYASAPCTLSAADYATIVARCSGVALQAAMDAVHDADSDASPSSLAPAMRREVHQATGVVLVQLGISASEAFFVLRAHAYSTGRSILETAQAVLAGDLDFRELRE